MNPARLARGNYAATRPAEVERESALPQEERTNAKDRFGFDGEVYHV